MVESDALSDEIICAAVPLAPGASSTPPGARSTCTRPRTSPVAGNGRSVTTEIAPHDNNKLKHALRRYWRICNKLIVLLKESPPNFKVFFLNHR